MKDREVNNYISREEEKSLLTLLREYGDGENIPFHMPGHKRAEFDFLQGMQKTDITEIDGFDDLHDAKGIIKDAQERAAKVFGAKHTRFLINGSTCGILAAIRGSCKQNDEILIARNCHKSVYNAAEISSLVPHYVMPVYFREYGFYGEVRPQDVENALSQYPKTRLVVITSPTYEGIISDVKTIAEICKKHGALLFVDEAHGAHLGFDGFEKSARSLGADIVVNSLHKTLPSLTQTALLHICSDRVGTSAIDKNLAMFQSSSPSYVLMSSIDGCVRYLQNKDALIAWSARLDVLRKKLSCMKNIGLFCGEGFAYDKSKLVFLCGGCGMSGVEVANLLRKKYGIEVEMSGANHLIAMSGAGDGDSSFDKLFKAISEIDYSTVSKASDKMLASVNIPQKAFEPYQIDGLSVEFENIALCENRVAAENIWAYPPGSPIVVKGEKIDKRSIDYLLELAELGVNVSGEYKRFPYEIAVLR